jgi:hypothetical protein
MLIEIDVRDHMNDREWKQLRADAVKEILSERGPVTPCLLNDLREARDALLANRHGDALLWVERAIAEATHDICDVR